VYKQRKNNKENIKTPFRSLEKCCARIGVGVAFFGNVYTN
jgi:hypothetical protein